MVTTQRMIEALLNAFEADYRRSRGGNYCGGHPNNYCIDGRYDLREVAQDLIDALADDHTVHNASETG